MQVFLSQYELAIIQTALIDLKAGYEIAYNQFELGPDPSDLNLGNKQEVELLATGTCIINRIDELRERLKEVD